MKKSYQKPLTLDEQVENLTKIGLKIKDVEYTKKVLRKISYYRLIKAYSITLKENGRYKKEITFENIVDLYLFDMELRNILFSLIEHIEVYLRAVITNNFSLKYGNFGYKDSDNFKNKKCQENIINEIEKNIKRNRRSPFIKNFKENYENGEIPLYAAIEVVGFGSLSKMYKNMKNEDKKEIAKIFNVEYIYLESWIENLSYLRNICAHYGRLYGAKFTKSPKLYKEFTKQGISNNVVFASMLNLRILAESKYYNKFYKNLLKIIREHKFINLKSLGFTENWQELLNYK